MILALLAQGLINENMLHPLDSYTGYIFKKGEWCYNMPLLPMPSPGWAWWGITDRITTELDLECLLGGVPSFNLRFGLGPRDKDNVALAYETMFQYLPERYDLLEGYDTLNTFRQGISWYHRLNLSWRLSERWRVHVSTGATYSEFLLIENANRPVYHGREFRNLVSPDISVGIDWRPKTWLSVHGTLSYGSTFIYLDNVPRKCQAIYGFRVAPFLWHRWGILRNMRAEFPAFIMYFPDARETVAIPVPIFPYVYWQWGG